MSACAHARQLISKSHHVCLNCGERWEGEQDVKESLELVHLHDVRATGAVRKITLGSNQDGPTYQVVLEFGKLSAAQMTELFGLHKEGIAEVHLASRQQSFDFDHAPGTARS